MIPDPRAIDTPFDGPVMERDSWVSSILFLLGAPILVLMMWVVTP